MMNFENVKAIRAGRVNWSRLCSEIRGCAHYRRDGLISAAQSAIIFGYAYTDPQLGAFVDESLVPESSAQLVLDVLIALALGTCVTLAVRWMMRIARRLGVGRVWNDLRDNPRYARFGMQSAFLAACVTAYWYWPTNIDFRTWIEIIFIPALWATHMSVIACGFGLAIIMGLIGGIRADTRGRALGVAGALLAANGLCVSSTFQSFFAHLWGIADFVAWCVFGCLPAVVYESSGRNLVLGVAAFLIPFAVIWIAFRGDTMRPLAKLAAGRRGVVA